jgi:hypothetical protein
MADETQQRDPQGKFRKENEPIQGEQPNPAPREPERRGDLGGERGSRRPADTGDAGDRPEAPGRRGTEL